VRFILQDLPITLAGSSPVAIALGTLGAFGSAIILGSWLLEWLYIPSVFPTEGDSLSQFSVASSVIVYGYPYTQNRVKIAIIEVW